jgi:glycosyltransferase involved in cell wall biosynthesis
MNDDRVLALVPAYNESARVGPVIEGAKQHLPVLCVDDGSVDDTAKVAEAAGASVLVQSPNAGKGMALRAGFRWAMENGYSAVLTLDADGQHLPEEMPRFLEAYRRDRPDLIIGARDFSHMPFVRRMSNTIGRKSFSWALGAEIRDNQSGYRLITSRLMNDLLVGEEAGFEFEVEMIAICVRGGYELGWVPISTIYLDDRESHINPVEHVVKFYSLVWRVRQRQHSRRQA